jgi:hypothetical protein
MRIRSLFAAFAAVCTLGAAPVAQATTFSFSFAVESVDQLQGLFLPDVSPDDALSLTVTGLPCLQSGGTFCTNAAGVVVVPGSNPVGGSLINGSNGTTFGSLLLEIDGIVVQLFATDAANGSGSANPPTSLTLSTTFADLGFTSSELIGAQLFFEVSDTVRTDNLGAFQIDGTFTPAAVGSVPEPAPWTLGILGAFSVLVARRRVRR